jgi:hypothetical protein
MHIAIDRLKGTHVTHGDEVCPDSGDPEGSLELTAPERKLRIYARSGNH